MIDSHCHLNYLENYHQVIFECAHFKILNNICTKKDDFTLIKFLAKKYFNVYGSYGIHPNYATHENSEDYSLDSILKNLEYEKILSIGETGIDLYRSHMNINNQINSFKNHIKASKISGKPLIIHCRSTLNSENAAYSIGMILEEEKFKGDAILHSFDGSEYLFNLGLKYNFYISISGLCTYKKNLLLRNQIKKIPLDKLLIETDSPYLVPINKPYTKVNHPKNVMYIAQEIAKILDIKIDEVFEITYNNYKNLYKNFLSPS